MKLKKALSSFLATIIVFSTFVFTSNSSGTLIFRDDFSTGLKSRYWITDSNSCLFNWNKKSECIVGFSEAQVLQSNYSKKYNKCWESGYMSIDFQIREFDDCGDGPHSVGIWYRDCFEVAAGEQNGAVYTYFVDIDTGEVTLSKSNEWTYYDIYGIKQTAKTDVVITDGYIDTEIEMGYTAPYYELGWRITKGKIECYFNGKLVLSAETDPTDPKYGNFTMNSVDETVGTHKSPFIFWNHGNLVALDNFEVWSEDYDPTFGTDTDEPEIPDTPIFPDESSGELDFSKHKVGFDIKIDPVNIGDTKLTANLLITLPEKATGYELGSYSLLMNYDTSVMQLAKDPSWRVKGTTINSASITDLPYTFIWLSINPDEQYVPGTTLAATIDFNLTSPAMLGSEYSINLAIDKVNGIYSMPSADRTYAEIEYTQDQIYVSGDKISTEIPADQNMFRIENGTLIQYLGNDNEITIPDGVVKIGKEAFIQNENITSVIIPDSVIEIDDTAFIFCEKLEVVVLPPALEKIGDGAFAFCSSLYNIKIPDSVTEIGDSAFDSCVSLCEIYIPDSVTSIGQDAFNDCTSLTLRCYNTATAASYVKENRVNYRLIISGDTDDDGEINLNDLVCFNRLVNGANLVVGRGADANRDGVLNLNDLTLISRITNGATIA